MDKFKLLYFMIIIISLYNINAQISDKRLCGDKECKEPVALAKTLLRYSSPDSRILSFAPNVDVTIYSKSAGTHMNLWGAEINGKRGYIPKTMIREIKKLKNADILVDTELVENNKQEVPLVEPNKVEDSFEIVDGTTIYLNAQDAIVPSSTESPIQPTALPVTTEDTSEAKIADINKSEESKETTQPTAEVTKEVDTQGSVVGKIFSKLTNLVMESVEDTNDSEDEDDEEEESEDEEDDVDEDISVEDEEEDNEIIPKNSKEKASDLIIDNILAKDVEKVSKVGSDINNNNSSEAGEIVKEDEKKLRGETDLVDEGKVEKKESETIKFPPTIPAEPTESDVVSEENNEDQKTSREQTKIAEKVETEMPSTLPKSLKNSTEQLEAKEIVKPVLVEEIPTKTPAIEDIPIKVTTSQEILTEISTNEEMLAKISANEEIPTKISTAEEIPTKTPTNEEILSKIPTNEEIPSKISTNEEIPIKIPINEEITSQIPTNEEISSKVATSEEIPPVEEVSTKTSTNEEVPTKVSINEGISTEASPVEVTTEFSNIEIPQPLDLINEEVTPNPADLITETPNELGAKKVEEDIIATLPPLGLFSNNKFIDSNKIEQNEIVGTNDKSGVDINASNELETNMTIEEISEKSPNEAAVMVEEEKINDLKTEEESSEEIDQSAIIENDTNIGDEEVNGKTVQDTEGGLMSNIYAFFGGGNAQTEEEIEVVQESPKETLETVVEDHEKVELTENDENGQEESSIIEPDDTISTQIHEEFCDASSESCNKIKSYNNQAHETHFPKNNLVNMDYFNFNSDLFMYLITTSASVIIFLFGYIAFDKSKREGPLIAKINKLEKELLIVLKENQIVQEKFDGNVISNENDFVRNEIVEQLKNDLIEMENTKISLEEQIQSLEKELENSTEVGMELNNMLSEILSSQNGSEVLKGRIDQLQRQLIEQQVTINSINETLAIKDTENHELQLEVEINNKKVIDLQSELDKLLTNILKIEEEKEHQQNTLENEILIYKQKYQQISNQLQIKEDTLNNELKNIKIQLEQTERNLQRKTNEIIALKQSINNDIKSLKNNDGILKSLLDTSEMKAELELLKTENQKYLQRFELEQELKCSFEKKLQLAIEEAQRFKEKYDEGEKQRVEAQTKLDVLSNYFKDKETQLQKELSKHESMWLEQQGEATSITERIKFMQEELQNYKAQNESLKQEIISQEVELKSQISMLEKKVHENWVSGRQAERKLEDAKQEAAQLRHRLTLSERALQEEKIQNRLQTTLEQNGDIPVSPLHVDSPASPPLLYGTRDHITKSPPIPGLPPFLPPPPPGVVPFMPPPLHGVPPFMPPPPNMFPGDHRPPPLGRMSSPPLNSRYSPDSRAYSPYSRNSPSPPYDSEYGTSPPPMHHRGYSPYSDRRDYKRPPPPSARSNGRNVNKSSTMSSGSGNSNESLEKITRNHSKV